MNTETLVGDFNEQLETEPSSSRSIRKIKIKSCPHFFFLTCTGIPERQHGQKRPIAAPCHFNSLGMVAPLRESLQFS